MPQYLVTGTKELKSGAVQTIKEVTASLTKAEWARAQYVAHGFSVTITPKEDATT